MRAPAWFVVASLIWSVGLADADKKVPREPSPLPVDLNPNKEPVLVLKDANGGTYVIVGEPSSTAKKAFYGTGKQLYEQISVGGSRNGDAWEISTWSPRIPEIRPGGISRRRDGTYVRSCDGLDDAVLSEVVGDKAQAVIEKSQFLSPGLVRRPHLLARDDMGIYYYVDKLAERHGGKAFRVFVGKRGAMRQMPLVDIAMDSAGSVFSTKTGDLRLVDTHERATGTKKTSMWVKGSKKTELFILDLDVNSVVIFKELGIYKLVGGICDNV
ncbi:MAG: hypothetical protein ACKV2T_01055 [Kofleriaceae bacterium]